MRLPGASLLQSLPSNDFRTVASGARYGFVESRNNSSWLRPARPGGPAEPQPTDLTAVRLGHRPAWMQAWHLWTVLLTRRSITGRLVFGQVWRRHDGRH